MKRSLLALAAGVAAWASVMCAHAAEPRTQTVARGLQNPWALAFLPDGRMLVTEKAGRLRIVGADGSLGAP
ncbi:PQQ-dependent sugar dehydrogenase, partial [Cronobacter muytjensii]|uniref:PQQ-dependent sugar dehydrogenase n=1 Tax=Cronobacter muytjensii TaxID=413501 RepID=UPI0034D50282